jgi:hypothetical protein
MILCTLHFHFCKYPIQPLLWHFTFTYSTEAELNIIEVMPQMKHFTSQTIKISTSWKHIKENSLFYTQISILQ